MDIKKSPLLLKPDYLVCTCMGVMRSEIIQTIKDGACSFAELQDQLLVGTGCNSCIREVKEILQESYQS